MSLQNDIENLFERQMAEWPLASENYGLIRQAPKRSVRILWQLGRLQVAFNPTRKKSTTANVSPSAIKRRKCFLCGANQPAEQEGLRWTSRSGNNYRIQVNPYPITDRHFTIADTEHRPQLIAGRLNDMHELAELLPDYAILYNGPRCGASAPDHFHFQAVPAASLPLTGCYFTGDMLNKLKSDKDVYLISQNRLWCPNISIVIRDGNSADHYGTKVLNCLPLKRYDHEPKFNIVCWKEKTQNLPFITILPRKCHRPPNFGTGKGLYLVSPGVIDMAGLVTTVNEEDYRRLQWDTVETILRSVAYDSLLFDNIIEQIKRLKL